MASDHNWTFGIIGGTGMLGGAMARAIINKRAFGPGRLWLSNRSGTAEGFDGAMITSDAQQLADMCDVVLLCVPPAAVGSLEITAPDRLVISVMAGVSLDQLQQITGARRVIRAMSSPAAEYGLAYTPWCARSGVTTTDRARATALFEVFGKTDEVTGDEGQIDLFTAMTGPVPGFVAFFADAMTRFAQDQGIAPRIADRAVRQLFLGAGEMMTKGEMTPSEHVQEMIDYAGTTAAGLKAMQASAISDEIADGLLAAVAKARAIAK